MEKSIPIIKLNLLPFFSVLSPRTSSFLDLSFWELHCPSPCLRFSASPSLFIVCSTRMQLHSLIKRSMIEIRMVSQHLGSVQSAHFVFLSFFCRIHSVSSCRYLCVLDLSHVWFVLLIPLVQKKKFFLLSSFLLLLSPRIVL